MASTIRPTTGIVPRFTKTAVREEFLRELVRHSQWARRLHQIMQSPAGDATLRAMTVRTFEERCEVVRSLLNVARAIGIDHDLMAEVNLWRWENDDKPAPPVLVGYW